MCSMVSGPKKTNGTLVCRTAPLMDCPQGKKDQRKSLAVADTSSGCTPCQEDLGGSSPSFSPPSPVPASSASRHEKKEKEVLWDFFLLLKMEGISHQNKI